MNRSKIHRPQQEQEQRPQRPVGLANRESHFGAQQFTINYAELVCGQLLGYGRYGRVYKYERNGTTVAVKDIAISPKDDVERLHREAKIHTELRNKNIISLHDSFLLQQNLLLVMEFAYGGSLSDVLKSHFHLLEPSIVTDWAAQVAEGMRYLHEKDVVHRDLKSSNILVLEPMGYSGLTAKTLKIADFGLACTGHAETRTMSEVAGTKFWIAPEILERGHFSKASDVWSFGALVWNLLTGKDPCEHLATRFQLTDGSPRMLSFYNGLLKKCLKTKHWERPSFRNILWDIYQWQGQNGIEFAIFTLHNEEFGRVLVNFSGASRESLGRMSSTADPRPGPPFSAQDTSTVNSPGAGRESSGMQPPTADPRTGQPITAQDTSTVNSSGAPRQTAQPSTEGGTTVQQAESGSFQNKMQPLSEHPPHGGRGVTVAGSAGASRESLGRQWSSSDPRPGPPISAQDTPTVNSPGLSRESSGRQPPSADPRTGQPITAQDTSTVNSSGVPRQTAQPSTEGGTPVQEAESGSFQNKMQPLSEHPPQGGRGVTVATRSGTSSSTPKKPTVATAVSASAGYPLLQQRSSSSSWLPALDSAAVASAAAAISVAGSSQSPVLHQLLSRVCELEKADLRNSSREDAYRLQVQNLQLRIDDLLADRNSLLAENEQLNNALGAAASAARSMAVAAASQQQDAESGFPMSTSSSSVADRRSSVADRSPIPVVLAHSFDHYPMATLISYPR